MAGLSSPNALFRALRAPRRQVTSGDWQEEGLSAGRGGEHRGPTAGYAFPVQEPQTPLEVPRMLRRGNKWSGSKEAKGRLLAWDGTLGTVVICPKNGH